MRHFLFLLSVAFLISCAKTETRTCVCKSPSGTVLRSTTHSGDKKSARQFEDKCRRDGTITNTSSTTDSTTTSSSVITPCELQ